jgi:ATP-dependent RNA helicase DeaD
MKKKTPADQAPPDSSADENEVEARPADGMPDGPTFASLGLSPAVLQAVDGLGYEAPTPIQSSAIPPLLAGRDLFGQAQTGTGKTAAFALPLLSRVDASSRELQILVLTPTRELAIQVAEAMMTYARHLPGFHVLPVYGGQDIETQLRALRRGVQAVVGTPGRIQDHLRRGTLKLDRLFALVLDEADEMLRMGFIEEVEAILELTPKEKQVALFSATLPEPIKKVARRHLRDPVSIHITQATATVAKISQRYWPVSGIHKLDALTRILEVEDFEAMLIFVRTKVETVELAEKLEARGFSASPLNGDMNQALRERTIDRLRSGALDIVIATDVAARGLDVERVSHVVNYDIPYDTEAYIHRIGRTGRAGREGVAILFVAPREQHSLRAIERATRQPIERMRLPSRADIADRRVTAFKANIAEILAGEQDLDYFAQLIEEVEKEQEVSAVRIAAALTYQLQKERPLLPDIPDEPPPRQEGPRERGPRYEGQQGGGPPRFDRYRIEVGHRHGVQAKNIVGAIANEANLEGRRIGEIEIHETYSLVDLPENMPGDIFRLLRKVKVCGQELQLRLIAGGRPDRDRSEQRFRPEPPGKNKPALPRPSFPNPEPPKAAAPKAEAPPAEKEGGGAFALFRRPGEAKKPKAVKGGAKAPKGKDPNGLKPRRRTPK